MRPSEPFARSIPVFMFSMPKLCARASPSFLTTTFRVSITSPTSSPWLLTALSRFLAAVAWAPIRIDDVWQTEGVNDRVQLARMNAEVNRRIVTGWMRAGVTIIDPTSTWIQPDVDLANDVTLYPGVFLNGATTIGAGATVGPDVTVTDSEIREEATVTPFRGHPRGRR